MYPEFIPLVIKYDDVINNHVRCASLILVTDDRDIHAQSTVMRNNNGTSRRQNSMPAGTISSEEKLDEEVSEEEDDEAQERNCMRLPLFVLTLVALCMQQSQPTGRTRGPRKSSNFERNGGRNFSGSKKGRRKVGGQKGNRGGGGGGSNSTGPSEQKGKKDGFIRPMIGKNRF